MEEFSKLGLKLSKSASSVAWGNSLVFSKTWVRYRSGKQQGKYGCGSNPKIWQRQPNDGFQKLGVCPSGRDEYALVRDGRDQPDCLKKMIRQ